MAELRVITAEPVTADTVVVLETMLERARKGELSSVAIAAVTRDGAATTTWSALPSAPAILGALQILSARIIARFV
ncbi:hypothetical protein BSL82_10115 [Tardibacter chloracetimidivorans]|uniref:Uncharacterized protein n=1 Tax=Tardibacter chloracetimidivorans TaxID=1921510 RepID=A0A1L3ZVG9_9SPHN|nr:hypothetical protein [Tardibacter chloracetimidivorans]API59628.1 hypothetical protein BSL82_10115 [Tardibacter chloracetimidivorans]